MTSAGGDQGVRGSQTIERGSINGFGAFGKAVLGYFNWAPGWKSPKPQRRARSRSDNTIF
jgi:hypothetical protein